MKHTQQISNISVTARCNFESAERCLPVNLHIRMVTARENQEVTMRKQTHMLAVMAAALLALTWLASGGKLQAGHEVAAPYVDIPGLVPAAAPLEGVEQASADEIPAMESEALGSDAADVANVTGNGAAVSFTATTGLDEFSSYRMEYVVGFDGARQGQPTSGNVEGTLEATNNPDAQHLQAVLAGKAFRQLGAPGTVELYHLNDTIYFQDPQNGAWIGVPGRLVSRFLPDGIPSPQDYIELPVTAVRQPGQRVVNGVVTQRYIFGREDLADGRNYEDAGGTIWVAVNGDYIVRYDASFTGRHENLATGGVELMDNGTISVSYDLSDVDDDLTIEAPEGARGLGLGDLLRLSGSLR